MGTVSRLPHTADTCTIATHDHFGQIEAAENAGLPVPASDELICSACDRRMFYDTASEAYRHAEDPERGCFLIPAEVPT